LSAFLLVTINRFLTDHSVLSEFQTEISTDFVDRLADPSGLLLIIMAWAENYPMQCWK